jgi:ABC-2 type transport system ATP-binding protein
MSDMMICAQNLNKQYGDFNALTDINFDIKSGEIVGLLGPNGAGKTTLLRSMLGLLPYTGQISICGINPKKERLKLLEHLCFISDVATLPNWMSVEQAIQYVDGVHPRFDKKLAEKLIRDTNIQFHSKVSALSKGMVTQLHLALVMAIDAKVLILDEPTLGLDIVNRKHFYTRLLEDYFDENKTIIISTHQIEEIQHIISELMIINDGKIVTKIPFNTYADTYIQLQCGAEQVDKAKALNPIFEQKDFNGYRFIYENTNRDALQQLGVVNTPDISDVFIATIKKEKENA